MLLDLTNLDVEFRETINIFVRSNTLHCMTKNLIRLAFITIPIIIVIGFIRINLGIDITTNSRPFQDNYLAVAILTTMFSMSWIINILLVKFFDRPVYRYIISFLAISGFILLLIFTVGDIVFANQDRFLIHPFWGGLVFNAIVLALCNFAILKTSRDAAELKVNELKRVQLEAEKKLLVQQLQPHFLFNALSTLKSLINEDQSKATDYTVKLSEFLRYSVASSNKDTVTVKSELDFTKDYIKLQSERFIGAVESEITIPRDILNMDLPVFSLQTLVENAFKHNLFSPDKPLRIKIYFEDGLISVSNNKSSSKASNLSMGTGLKNLDERFHLIADTSIIVKESEDTFTVSIKPITI